MINFNHNNLDQAISPYLQQHQDHPIHWQEWSSEVLDYAQRNNKIILVSVGYATCHWCHVMAREAFSDPEVAHYLNTHFVSIKVDREQRPDIDNYMMSFIQETQGSGGWPLNVFLAPDLTPFLAVTYLPVIPRYGLPGFPEVLQDVKKAYEQPGAKVPPYCPLISPQQDVEEQNLILTIKHNFTNSRPGPQFPPHNTLLFLLHYYEKSKDEKIRNILEKILEVMARRGLHDHLQGGFYRYCVDDSWTIPHFEKMLYDQAMLLWVYSTAYKVLQKPWYQKIAEKIIICVEDTYAGDLYYAAHDADTNHHEGGTYLWEAAELQQILSATEYRQFLELYLLEEKVEGKIHLLKQDHFFLPELEQKLLQIRKKRPQPFTDKKFITSWNALLGIAFMVSYRYIGKESSKIKAVLLFHTILKKHYHDGILHHSSFEGKLQSGEFLEDYAAMLLFATYMHEETGEFQDLIEEWSHKLAEFYTKNWMENKTPDFRAIPAQTRDHPMPASASVAEMARLRASLILGKEYAPATYRSPGQHDFFNLMTFIRQGNWHIFHAPHKIEWKHLPANSMQISNTKIQDCYQQQCREFKDITQLLGSLSSIPLQKIH